MQAVRRLSRVRRTARPPPTSLHTGSASAARRPRGRSAAREARSTVPSKGFRCRSTRSAGRYAFSAAPELPWSTPVFCVKAAACEPRAAGLTPSPPRRVPPEAEPSRSAFRPPKGSRRAEASTEAPPLRPLRRTAGCTVRSRAVCRLFDTAAMRTAESRAVSDTVPAESATETAKRARTLRRPMTRVPF